MEHHFVVYFDTKTGKWEVDTETTDSHFEDGNVYNENTEDAWSAWEEWNDETSKKLNDLIAILDKVNELASIFIRLDEENK